MSKPVVYVTPARSSAARFPQGAKLRTARKNFFSEGTSPWRQLRRTCPGGGRSTPLRGKNFRGSRPLGRLAAATGRWQPEQGQSLPNINAWVGMWVEPEDRLSFPVQLGGGSVPLRNVRDRSRKS